MTMLQSFMDKNTIVIVKIEIDSSNIFGYSSASITVSFRLINFRLLLNIVYEQ